MIRKKAGIRSLKSRLKNLIYPPREENEPLSEDEIEKQKFFLPVHKSASDWFAEDASNDEWDATLEILLFFSVIIFLCVWQLRFSDRDLILELAVVKIIVVIFLLC